MSALHAGRLFALTIPLETEGFSKNTSQLPKMTERTKLLLRFESPSLPAATASIKQRIFGRKEDGQSQADAKSWKHTMNYKAMEYKSHARFMVPPSKRVA